MRSAEDAWTGWVGPSWSGSKKGGGGKEKKDWFIGVCAEAGIDPATSTLFDYLEADDKLIGKN